MVDLCGAAVSYWTKNNSIGTIGYLGKLFWLVDFSTCLQRSCHLQFQKALNLVLWCTTPELYSTTVQKDLYPLSFTLCVPNSRILGVYVAIEMKQACINEYNTWKEFWIAIRMLLAVKRRCLSIFSAIQQLKFQFWSLYRKRCKHLRNIRCTVITGMFGAVEAPRRLRRGWLKTVIAFLLFFLLILGECRCLFRDPNFRSNWRFFVVANYHFFREIVSKHTTCQSLCYCKRLSFDVLLHNLSPFLG